MPFKKRRLSGSSSSAGGGGVGMDEDSTDRSLSDAGGAVARRSTTPEPGAPRKRRKIDPAQQMQMLFEFIRRYKKEDGTELCEAFIRCPKRRTEPAYYDVVQTPMDILRIQQKLKTDEYENMEEFKQDFDLIINNSKAYFKDGSQEFREAVELQNLFRKALKAVEAGEDPVDSLGCRQENDDAEMMEMCENLFDAVMQAVDPGDPNRALSKVFRLVPSAKRYPEYYKVISEPIDLKTIGGKIQSGDYAGLEDLHDDLNLLCKNSLAFNEPGSQIYKDARSIQKLVKSKKLELEANKIARENRGSTRTRRTAAKCTEQYARALALLVTTAYDVDPQKRKKNHLSAEIAALEYEDSESEESEGDAELESDDPLWMLYNTVRYYQTPSGINLGEPFVKLPSKRELPDYYETIMEPISLNLIRRKLRAGDYAQLVDLADDLNTMFENCKSYNRAESRLHKEGSKLQKIMNAKLDELESVDDDEGDEGGDDDDDEGGASASERSSPAKSSAENQLRKRLRIMYNTLINFKTEDGIQIIDMFMDKPDRAEYPDYYEVIACPMDMETINERVKAGVYKSEDECLKDFKLIFSNCQQYNEQGSDIYEDSKTLERVLMNKARELGVAPRKGRKKPALSLPQKIKVLGETLRDHKDAKGRQLSIIFLRLPNPKEFLDYYEVIKKPIDFEKISIKSKQGLYNTLEEALADFVLMFDNACTYNESSSQIYKDALTLQNLAHKTYRNLMDDDDSVTNVQCAVQDILNSIFIAMYNHTDAEERCFSDSLSELPEHNEAAAAAADGAKPTRALNLDVIKRRLDRGLYKRLDIFQRDVFAVLERARHLSRTDSQVFEDSVELQSYFIKQRDEACGNGDALQSRALLYTQADLAKAVDTLKAAKQVHEQPDEETGDGASMHGNSTTSFATFNEQQFYIGDFVYVETAEKTHKPLIFLIERIFFNAEAEQMIYGNQFYRPNETFHVPSRKFLETEVFRTEIHQSVSFKQLVGKCWVMSVREYYRSKPEGYEDKDVYVCESRYQVKARSFKKLKAFWLQPEHIRIVARPQPLELRRVQSFFKERIEKHKEEIEELEALEKVVDEEIPSNVLWSNPEGGTEGCVYFEQYTIPGPITLRRGDCVYVRSENGKNLIAQIDTMWSATDGMAYFHGPWFVTPSETEHSPNQMFYKQEVFLSTISDSNPLLSVVGRCVCLEMADYCKSRPTSYAECDVYLCESLYDESKRMVRGSLPNGLKQYETTVAVTADEVYFFKKQITPQTEPSPLMVKGAGQSGGDLNDDSMDAPSVGSEGVVVATPQAAQTGKKIKPGKKVVTAYILFSSEVRKLTCDENKGSSFGQISRIVGDKWRQLLDSEKQVYEERARKLNEESAIKFAEEQRLEQERKRLGDATPSSVGAAAASSSPCARAASSGLTLASLGLAASTVVAGLAVAGGGAAAGRAAATGAGSPQTTQQQRTTPSVGGGGQSSCVVVGGGGAKPVEPIFHTVPPRPPRLLHSETYIRYIEGLTSDSATMSNWEKQLNASKETTRTDEARLPAHWLADNGDYGTSLDALWALRDFMMCDSLGVMKML